MTEHVAGVAVFGPAEPKLLEGYTANAPVIACRHSETESESMAPPHREMPGDRYQEPAYLPAKVRTNVL